MSPEAGFDAAVTNRPRGKWAELSIKAVLSVAVLAVFASIPYLVRLALGSHRYAPPAAANAAQAVQSSEGREGRGGEGDQVFWPHLPGSAGRAVHRMTINGVDTISEDWRTSTPAADVIDYYREQMLARGWRDETEESFGLQPETRNPGVGANGLLNPKFVQAYGSLVNSALILSRGKWSMQVMAVPGETGIRQTAVRVFAAATPSIKDFFLSLEEGAFRAGPTGAASGAIDTVEESGGQRSHTTLVLRNGEPGRIFDEMIGQYREKGWQCLVTPPPQGQPAYFAWLVKERAYAALSVRGLPQGRGASVTLTEIAPK